MKVKTQQTVATLFISIMTVNAYAAETMKTSNATASLFKMLIGLAIVLLVLAGISWAMKKYMGGVHGQQSVINVVGGVSVGTRERVVVLEVKDRWLVVGVASGQVTSLADLEAGDASMTAQMAMAEQHNVSANASKKNVFSKWLKASTTKMAEKNDA